MTNIEWSGYAPARDPLLLPAECQRALERYARLWPGAENIPPLLEVEYDDFAPVV